MTLSSVITAPTRVDAPGTTTLAVDPFGRVTSLTPPGFGAFTTTYGADGQPMTAADPNGNTTTSTYDALGRLTTTVTGTRASYGYGYNRAGSRLSRGLHHQRRPRQRHGHPGVRRAGPPHVVWPARHPEPDQHVAGGRQPGPAHGRRHPGSPGLRRRQPPEHQRLRLRCRRPADRPPGERRLPRVGQPGTPGPGPGEPGRRRPRDIHL